ncbi:voltage-dependent calcium channel subunit alpha-2/delta-3 isoform X1 [Ischnura elegans]|uniref:voltage-dependent calcium channel subunit alpha-2/delta-3 isoform X1 n=1 Tax=Ischnura elegans TaxID=197161 RepID=UPI001ED8B8A9|nr:voltage-dependent calcium channel subunit alpha-2/delta-3 isoform X1 [Ischnura elegans]
MKEMVLKPSRHFQGTPVNTSYSSVHVPTNVYDKAPDVIKAIKWSEDLDPVFISNYQVDPSLSWQYFGSSHGFMRQYPAIQWKQEPVDLFDCRTRSWYIEAATSPKDIVVLVDFSGSMTGMRKEVARHVVSNILDTLSNNDYVNIFNFSEETSELVPCFRDLLVQANLGNVRELKMAMEDIETKDIANFTSALIKAFELLQVYREERQGARCNQAIMLVTDGVPYNFREIFEEYNWRKLPFMPVRVFTYLIGKEVADVKEVKWMACENQGYYVHLSTLAEVREQVLNYIPVMARPMVLNKTEHPIVWTPVYADVTDPKMTDWLWEVKECAEQKSRFESYRKNRQKFHSAEEQGRQYDQKLKRVQNQSGDSQEYQLMTSVSMPVFDRRENANITERVLVNEAYWVQRMRETRIANLLGVAGTDIPIQDIQKLMAPHMLGVNAYAFIVTNNGYVLIHPDLRPVFQGILKPSYNSVDMAEVELVDDNSLPREFSPELLAFRDAVINQTTGSAVLSIKYHYDDMKRVSRLKRRYSYAPIANTPFTLVVAIPEQYGMYRVHAVEEIRRSHAEGTSVTKYFKGKKWRIHPDWVYCKYLYDNEHPFESPEKELLHFLERTKQPGWKWPLKRSFPASDFITQSNTSDGKSDKTNKDSYFCGWVCGPGDRNLLLSLVFDAKVTEWFPKNVSQSSKEEKGPIDLLMILLPRKEFKQRFGITVSFVATRSGLTRWQDYPVSEEEASSEPHFSVLNKRAIDEVWYKRAVEQHFVDPDSYVYSVPFKGEYKNDSLVTASNAIFHTEGRRSAPAAVVGFQFRHSALYARFKNITSTCADSLSSCTRTCAPGKDLSCFALDNNGYVVVSTRSMNDTGMFFGDVKPDIMRQLVLEGVYNRIHIYDYQAVCFRPNEAAAQSSVPGPPPGPFRLFVWLMQAMVEKFMTFLSKISLKHLIWAYLPDYVRAFSSSDDDFESYENQDDSIGGSNTAHNDDSQVSMDEGSGGHGGGSSHHGGDMGNNKSPLNALLINRTRPQPCDQEVDLYLLQHQLITSDKGHKKNPYMMPSNHCIRPFVVQAITLSNLILVVVDDLCPDRGTMPTTLPPKGYDDDEEEDVEVGDLTVRPIEIDYNNTLACHKLRVVGELPRRNHGVCINSHPNENEITLCGRGSQLKPSHLLHITAVQLLFFLFVRTFGNSISHIIC